MGKDKESGSEQKKPASQGQQQEHKAPTGGGHQKGPSNAKVGCHASGCKDKDVKFNFCNEHFRQFKFGLITKHGEPVLDYEKKFEHYQRWKAAQKVA